MEEQVKTKEKVDLKSLNRKELQEFCEKQGLQSYRSDQVFQWLYQKGVSSFDEMTNLSKDLRSRLGEIAEVNRIEPVTQQESSDGTMKFLFRLPGEEDYKVEAVMIPDFYDDGVANRLTVCVSSQVGCVFGCSFCATGKMGFFRSLTHGEIVDQVQYINEICEEKFDKRITNIVYMGMGEPLHNYKAVVNSGSIICDDLGIGLSPKRITISTVGLTKQIKKLADERQPYNLSQLKEAVQYYYAKLHRPITYEYLLFDEFNDSPQDARELAQIAQWAPSKVNIIMYNDVAGVALKRAREQRLDAFMQELVKNDVTATVRRSRGDDIDAGCGQLAIKEGQARGKSIAAN